MLRFAWLSLVLALLLALGACGGDDDDAQGDTGAAGGSAITVYAAASLTEVFPTIDPAPQYNFAGSDELAAQIREGAPADVYAAASSKYPHSHWAQWATARPGKSRTGQR